MKTATPTAMKTGTTVALSLLLAGLGSAAAAAGVPGQGSWETTLQARDLDGDTVTDAFYDTALNVTWLRNANANGLMSWNGASAWAANLVVGAYSDWRLPTMIDTAAPGCDFSVTGGTDCGYNVQTKAGATVFSEMAHLYHVTLGNTSRFAPGTGVELAGYGLSNTGNFQNMQSDAHWSGLDYAPDALFAWRFHTDIGYQAYFLKNSLDVQSPAFAVRTGNVTAVPEVQTSALLLLGLSGLMVALRKRPR